MARSGERLPPEYVAGSDHDVRLRNGSELTPEHVERMVVEAIAETGASTPKDMGKVMKAVLAKLAGQTVDGKVVNEIVRQKLSSV